MIPDAGIIGQAGLQFFGKMCASISHDIKNVLAVINENAGLLEDLCVMAEKGRPIDPSRLKRLAADVKEQIRRGDRIVTGMNRFGHSADDASTDVDLSELLDLLAALALRFAAARGVLVQVNRPQSAVRITTSPFLLLNLMWLCLDGAMAAAGPGRTVELAAGNVADGACLWFRRIEGLKDAPVAFLSAELQEALCFALRAQLALDPDKNEMALLLPKNRG
jgi:K+-sensing histidine kinase KdpD